MADQLNDAPRLALWCALHPDDAATEIERLRSILKKCMPGANVVELGNGEVIWLYQRDEQS